MKNSISLLLFFLASANFAGATDSASLPPGVYHERVVSKLRDLNSQVFTQKTREAQLRRIRSLLAKAEKNKQEPEIIRVLDFEHRLVVNGECQMTASIIASEVNKLNWDCFENKISQFISQMPK